MKGLGRGRGGVFSLAGRARQSAVKLKQGDSRTLRRTEPRCQIEMANLDKTNKGNRRKKTAESNPDLMLLSSG